MKTYRITFTLPGIENSPKLHVTVEAANEDIAIDRGFDEAFFQYPQFGAFQVDALHESDA